MVSEALLALISPQILLLISQLLPHQFWQILVSLPAIAQQQLLARIQEPLGSI
jgi:hypothetical protein